MSTNLYRVRGILDPYLACHTALLVGVGCYSHHVGVESACCELLAGGGMVAEIHAYCSRNTCAVVIDEVVGVATFDFAEGCSRSTCWQPSPSLVIAVTSWAIFHVAALAA